MANWYQTASETELRDTLARFFDETDSLWADSLDGNHEIRLIERALAARFPHFTPNIAWHTGQHSPLFPELPHTTGWYLTRFVRAAGQFQFFGPYMSALDAARTRDAGDWALPTCAALAKRIFERGAIGFHVTAVPGADPEAVAQEVMNALDRIDAGDYEELNFDEGAAPRITRGAPKCKKPPRDVREWVAEVIADTDGSKLGAAS